MSPRWDDPLAAELYEQMIETGLDEDSAEIITRETLEDLGLDGE